MPKECGEQIDSLLLSCSDPVVLAAIERAFAVTWPVIRAHEAHNDETRMAELRKALSHSLIKLAAEGVTDPQELRRAALETFPLTTPPETAGQEACGPDRARPDQQVGESAPAFAGGHREAEGSHAQQSCGGSLIEEVVMQETKTANEASRIGEEVQETANRGFQALATEMTEFSKRRLEDVLHSWEQLLRVRHFGDVVEFQTLEAYTAEMSKLGEMWLGTARSASKPVEGASRKFR
jgi:Phasin protein